MKTMIASWTGRQEMNRFRLENISLQVSYSSQPLNLFDCRLVRRYHGARWYVSDGHHQGNHSSNSISFSFYNVFWLCKYRPTCKQAAVHSALSRLQEFFTKTKACFVFGKVPRSWQVVVCLPMPVTSCFMSTWSYTFKSTIKSWIFAPRWWLGAAQRLPTTFLSLQQMVSRLIFNCKLILRRIFVICKL